MNLSGTALGHWLVDQLIAPNGKVTLNTEALEQVRGALAKTKDMKELKESVVALGRLADHLGGERKEVKVGEAILKLIAELEPRFTAVAADRNHARVEKARDTTNRLGGITTPVEVPATDVPAVSAKSFRGAMRG